MGALSLGNLLLGSAAAPAMSAIASGYAGMGVESRIPWSALEYSGTDITAISGSAIGGNIDTSDFVHTADMSAYATTGDLADKLDKTATGDFITSTAGLQPAGDYAFNSSLTSKLDTSAFSSVSGTFLTAVPAGYATTAYVDSSVSGKLDETATAQFITSTAGLQPALTFGYSGSYISSIDGSAIIDSTAGGVDSATVSAIASSYAESAASGKLDTSAQVVTSLSIDTASGYVFKINGNVIHAVHAQSANSAFEATIAKSADTAKSAKSAGTAYSASTARQAESAYYDSIGRALSSLSDGTTARSSLTANVAKYDTLGRPLSSLGTGGGGGSVTSDYGTIWVTGSDIEGTNSAIDVSSRVEPGVNVTGGVTGSYRTANVLNNLTNYDFESGRVTGTINVTYPGTYSLYLTESGGHDNQVWVETATGWSTSYNIDFIMSSAIGSNPISAVKLSSNSTNFVQAGLRLSSEDVVVNESAVRELAWKDDIPTSADYLVPSASSTFYPMSGNPSGFLMTSNKSNFFHTSVLGSSISGHDTDFSIIFEPTQHSVEVSAIESAQLDTDTSSPDHFLPLNDYNADWFWTAGTGIIFPGQRLTAYASGVVTSHTEDKITARALTAYSHGAPVSGTSTGAAFMLGGIEMIPAYTDLGDGRSSFTAGTTADMTAITTDWTGTGDYSGTAVFAMSRYFFAPGFEQVSGWFKLDGSAGSATITQNDVCRVPGDAGDASTPIFISGGSSLPCTGLNWLSALSAWATAQGWTP